MLREEIERLRLEKEEVRCLWTTTGSGCLVILAVFPLTMHCCDYYIISDSNVDDDDDDDNKRDILRVIIIIIIIIIIIFCKETLSLKVIFRKDLNYRL